MTTEVANTEGLASSARVVAIAHSSAEMYGSDRQLRESVTGLMAAGWQPLVFLPEAGMLVEVLRAEGVDVRVVPFPVLRKSDLSFRGVTRLLGTVPRTVFHAYRALGAERVEALYVNTLTLPWWALGGWLSRTPVVWHVHEAEADGNPLIRRVLVAPLHLARVVIVNSLAARGVITGLLPHLGPRIRLVYNGVSPRHDDKPQRRVASDSARLAFVGRVSPRKGTDVAVEAAALLVGRGYSVSLDVCGSTFPGYEWFADQLCDRVERSNLTERITFHGFVSDIDAVLKGADVVLVPSRVEPFGNIAVEAQLACRPVVASRVQGLEEIIESGVTGLLVPPDDPEALATAIAVLLDEPEVGDRIAAAGRESAVARFSLDRYRVEIVAAVEDAVMSHAGTDSALRATSRRPGRSSHRPGAPETRR